MMRKPNRRTRSGARHKGPRLRRLAALALAAALAPAALRPAHAAPANLTIPYLGLVVPHPAPSAALTAPPQDDALAGAKLAIADDTTTGRFLGQSFTLAATVGSDPARLQAAFTAALAAGQRLFVLDVPPALLLTLAALPGASQATLLDATSVSDRLRGADCRANLLHLLPDRAMLADALMQYLVSKNWRRLFLVSGTSPADQEQADAIRASAAKFQLRIVADRPWQFNPAAQQADTGHFEVNAEVNTLTQGPNYDVLVVADPDGAFGDQIAYRSFRPRPVVGTAGLIASAWSPVMDEYASTELQLRFLRAEAHPMDDAAYGAWLAVRALGEAATRTGSVDPAKLATYLRSPAFALSGYKGPPFSFRPWDGQLRQPVLLGDTNGIVSVAPLPGFLHQTNTLDTLGVDQPETTCHLH